MTLRRPLLLAALLAVACRGGRPAAPPPAPAAPTTPVAEPLPPPPAAIEPNAARGVRLSPQQARFLAHQRVEIQNDYQGLPARQLIGFRSWFTVTLRDSADSAGRLHATFTVDSLAADSGVLLPPTMNLASARGLTVTGWVAPTGEFQDAVYSDPEVVRSLSLLLGWFRRFFPHLPPEGALAGEAWTDTVSTTEAGAGATVNRTTVVRARATPWEPRPEGAGLRIDVEESYEFTGAGDGGGQPLELRGSGTRGGVDYIAVDGRYLGGTSRDSASMNIRLPQQGITIPQRQIGTLTLTRVS